jgi:hypothetical protein
MVLRVDVDYHRAKCRELSALLRVELGKGIRKEDLERVKKELVIAEAQKRRVAEERGRRGREFAREFCARLIRRSGDLGMKFDIAQAKFGAELDRLALGIARLRAEYGQLRVRMGMEEGDPAGRRRRTRRRSARSEEIVGD